MKKWFIIITILFLALSSCSKKVFKEKWLKAKAPSVFKARFETSKGNFDIISKKEWSPKASERLYQLIKSGFYKDIIIYRVVPNFVAQFGINNDSILNKNWNKNTVIDEPVKKKNDSMTVSFARGGKNSRSTQLFINLKDNHRLDTLTYNAVTGFPVVAKVVKGMDVVLSLYNKYGDEVSRKQDSIYKWGNRYLFKNYPKLDTIKKAYIIK